MAGNITIFMLFSLSSLKHTKIPFVSTAQCTMSFDGFEKLLKAAISPFNTVHYCGKVAISDITCYQNAEVHFMKTGKLEIRGNSKYE